MLVGFMVSPDGFIQTETKAHSKRCYAVGTALYLSVASERYYRWINTNYQKTKGKTIVGAGMDIYREIIIYSY
ncbi:MAG: hypothetical protein L0I83_08190, partial [Enterobacterales bacterium]|nr:hypothetical protein [Enterobacterales bacterium]